jgi:hypothetical protein
MFDGSIGFHPSFRWPCELPWRRALPLHVGKTAGTGTWHVLTAVSHLMAFTQKSST